MSLPSVLSELNVAGQRLAAMDHRLAAALRGATRADGDVIRGLRLGIRNAQEGITDLNGPPDINYVNCDGIADCWELKQDCDSFECIENFWVACLWGICHDEY